jgi:hypothetical protein
MLKKYYLLIKKSIAFFFNSPSPFPSPQWGEGKGEGRKFKRI